ncbi:MAG: type III-B CRISPR module RAMP protein Cmr6 [Bacillota bacterium]|nr:type III-B CRISPR module RAMP protein Cmr6 [Bacillota bacterium]HOO30242.1 type III-B CRISPR module RAMP protein Cmr6 [Bacillota bacterium]
MLPLYKDAEEWLQHRQDSNLGLEYDKYIDEWSKTGDAEGVRVSMDPKGKQRFYARFATSPGNYCSSLLRDYRERRYRLLWELGGKVVRARTVWRFVSGLGASHPLEAGFIWHRTLGVPYLPSSSVKGMVRAWLTHWLGGADDVAAERARARAAELFGDTETVGMGRLMFFDAVPETPPRLEMDIMNPHYGPYYSDPQKNLPGDYYSPVPVNFLVVPAGQWFEFTLAPADPRCTEDDLAEGIELLQKALEVIGCGAKTAVGYGVFESFQDKTDEVFAEFRRQEENAELEKLSPLERKLRELEIAVEKEGQTDTIIKTTTDLYYEMSTMSDDDKLVVAQTLRDVWMAVGRWSGKLSKKQREKVAEVKRVLGEV